MHPDSKYAGQDDATKKNLIEKDYLRESFKWDSYKETLERASQFLLTKTQRLLKSWEDDLEERDVFMKSMPYNAETFDLKEKLMTNRLKMWQNYWEILKKVSQEVESRTQGDSELSLSEKGLI